jgi:farnesyl-diphosphate farnesyltransferase
MQQNDSQKAKQGAYGKVKIHKESKVSQLLRLDEVWSAVTFLYLKPLRSNLNSDYIQKTFPSSELQFCDSILVKVSRSFAAVIRQLPNTLLVDVMIFYLVLRALDTIEDDTTAFPSHIVKVEHLTDFYKRALYDSQWTLDGVGEGDERRLLQQFSNCQIIFSKLRPNSRAIIADITERMALGMAEFVDKDMGQGTKDIMEYNRYCHFVAGLVGEGLSRLFAASGLEEPELATEIQLSDQMGLFLQKVNIIRDYLEDYVDGRAWWPQSIWKHHSPTGDLGYFTDQDNPEVRKRSLQCLHDLVTDALELAPDCLAYMSKLRCAEIFRFCAIPQVMAIATLDALYGNPDVFTGVVKLRKGLSCKLMLHSNSIPELHTIFHLYASSISQKADVLYKAGTLDIASWEHVKTLCQDLMERTHSTHICSRCLSLQFSLFLMIGALLILEVLKQSSHHQLLETWGDNIVKVVQGIILTIASLIFLSSSHYQTTHDRLQTALELTSKQ